MVKIIPTQDGIKIFSENKIVGYVENDTLYGFDRDGYAIEVCRIDHDHEITGKFLEWHRRHH